MRDSIQKFIGLAKDPQNHFCLNFEKTLYSKKADFKLKYSQ